MRTHSTPARPIAPPNVSNAPTTRGARQATPAAAETSDGIELTERPAAHTPAVNMMQRAAAKGPVKSEETTALEQKMVKIGLGEEAFRALIPKGGKFVPSASYGKPVASPNDEVGIIVFPQTHRGASKTEMLAVVKDKVVTTDENGARVEQEQYFVKGYANRLVGMKELMDFKAGDHEPEAGKAPDPDMGISFLSHLYTLSSQSRLYARERPEDSDRVVMPLPPNARPLPRIDNWANGEPLLHPFGPKGKKPDGGKSDFHVGYVDYNDTENRLIFFLADQKSHAKGRQSQMRNGVTVPASTNVDGPIVAQIQGIKKVEVMGAAGVEAGVKLASLRKFLRNRDKNKVLNITTEDNAVHELRFTDKGIRLTRLLPRPGKLDAMTPLDDADISLYNYQGRNTGPNGSPEGYADPELILSTGDALKASTLTTDPTSTSHMLASAGRMALEVATLNPRIGNNPGTAAAFLNTGIKALGTGGAVMGMTALLNHVKDGGTLLPGAHDFSSSGAGHASPASVGGAVATIVPVQNMLNEVFDFMYDKTVPDAWKQKDNVMGQAINEFALPFLAESARLLVNYGIEKNAFDLPRGDSRDIASLFLTAALTTGVRLMRERSGDPAHHPGIDSVGIGMQFFLGDLVGRGLGAAASDPQRKGGIEAVNYGEAYLSRFITRVYDKLAAPLAATWLNHFGVTGDNAGAYDNQLNHENRLNGWKADAQALSQNITTEIDKYLAASGEAIRNDIEATAGPAQTMRKWAHRLHQNTDTLFARAKQANEEDMKAMREALKFPDMSPSEQDAYLEKLKDLTERRVAASAGEGDAVPIHNNMDELPPVMKKKISSLMDGFLAKYGPDAVEGEEKPLYITRPSPDFLGAPLPYDAKPSTTFGAKTRRIEQAITTFTREPVSDIKRLHDLLAESRGMPKKPEDSRAEYERLSRAILAQVWQAEVKYTVQSGPFHYKLRWNDTGQPHYTEVVPGVPLKTTRMNRRGNEDGDASRQVSGKDALLVNLGALHGVNHAGPVMRAVVSEAAYLQGAAPEGMKAIHVGDHVSLSEIFSVTNSSVLAAAFEAPQGYNSADSSRRARIVIDGDGHHPTPIPIADETDLKQVESLMMPGTAFVVSKIVSDPAKPGDKDKENLGQVIHLKRVNLWEQEVKYRKLAALNLGEADRSLGITSVNGVPTFRHDDLTLTDGEQILHPETGNFYKVSLKDGKFRLDFVRNKNYFLGSDLDGNEGQLGRTRFPYTAENSTRGVRDEINEMLLMQDAAVPYLNDMTKNVSYEIDRRAGGYYDPGNKYKQEDDQALAAMQGRAAEVSGALAQLRMDKRLPIREIGEGKPFPGQMLAEVAASALRKPLRMIQVDDKGAVVHKPGADGEPHAAVVCDIDKTFDKVDLRWEKEGHTMIGVGPHGYYSMAYKDGKLKATPVRINGSGHMPGNLLHAIAAGAMPNPHGSRYVEHNGVLKTADQYMPGAFPDDPPLFGSTVDGDIGKLFEKLKQYAGADYVPMQKWMAEHWTPTGEAAPIGPRKPSPKAPLAASAAKQAAAGKQEAAGKPSSASLQPEGAASSSRRGPVSGLQGRLVAWAHGNDVARSQAVQAARILANNPAQFARPNNVRPEDVATILAAEAQGTVLDDEFKGGVGSGHDRSMAAHVAGARATLAAAGLTTRPASGLGANCLIHSILDQVGISGRSGTLMAAEIRTELVKRLREREGIALAPAEHLESFGPHVAHLVDIINDRLPRADLAVRIYAPTEDGGLVTANGEEEGGSNGRKRSNAVAVMWVGQHYEPIGIQQD